MPQQPIEFEDIPEVDELGNPHDFYDASSTEMDTDYDGDEENSDDEPNNIETEVTDWIQLELECNYCCMS